MSLQQVQSFLTRCLRDEEFLGMTRSAGFDPAQHGFELTAQEYRQIREIDQDSLNRISQYALGQRIRRREAEYGLFLEHLGRFTDRGAFLRAYHQAATGGQGERLEEMPAFDDFAFRRIVGAALPEYLVDVLRFCSAVCELSETPKRLPPAEEAVVGADDIEGTHVISLRRPYRVVPFRYDVLRIATAEDDYSAEPSPRPTRLLVQREWSRHKRSRVVDLSEHPMLALLCERPLSVLDIGARLPGFDHGFLMRTVRRQAERGLVHATLPGGAAAEEAVGRG
ncbi:hypothetical protein GT045_08035 [Streptomyces sp. SID486]|uniref:hypothetical protein n=1 Tax=Streptomyces sp. SID486 TaxID=2690264 RepID=UPI0013696316|nr:hypothetical protein [Streptomyces sp. SID486]MYX94763.1 hypothetical protein [Streptomyces sp. SID486]